MAQNGRGIQLSFSAIFIIDKNLFIMLYFSWRSNFKWIYKQRENKNRTSFNTNTWNDKQLLGAIGYALQLGYKNIYLQGHSLGATKIVYTYNKMIKNNDIYLKYVKGIILLSLVDIPYMFDKYSTQEVLKYALRKEAENNILELMPNNSFLHPISVKTFLRYIKYNKNIDFAKFSEENYDFKELNRINVPLFMRWGNNKELIERKADAQVNFVNNKIKNNIKDINFIDGADHSFSDKEEILADEICTFLNKLAKTQ